VAILAPFVVLVLGAFIRHSCRQIPVPYTVLLLFFGGIMGYFGWGEDGEEVLGASTQMMGSIDPHLLLHIFLPPLIFESAFAIEWNIFNKVKWMVLFMAGPGLLFGTFFVGVGMEASEFEQCAEGKWTTFDGFLLGCILSATDPVAVVALLKELGVKADLSIAIEGESLLNDGTALVIFVTFLATVTEGDAGGTLQILWTFLKMSIGGSILGLCFGAASTFWLAIFNDVLVEITITIAGTYVCFFVAENVVGGKLVW
ncbi:unnamed protein product, partial [Discosporangium mesarthrocarpum]